LPIVAWRLAASILREAIEKSLASMHSDIVASLAWRCLGKERFGTASAVGESGRVRSPGKSLRKRLCQGWFIEHLYSYLHKTGLTPGIQTVYACITLSSVLTMQPVWAHSQT